jgi:hypothetical protein
MQDGSEYDPSPEDQAAAADRMAALEEVRADFIATFSTPAGEKTLLSLYDFCRQMRTTYTQDDPNGRHMTYLEGRRSVILMVLEHLHMDDVEIIERARKLAQHRR